MQKRMIGRLVMIAGTLSLYYLITPRAAYAYLDPGTGSYLFQILIAGLIGGAFAVKIFWSKIKAFFTKLFKKKSPADKDGPQNPNEEIRSSNEETRNSNDKIRNPE